jgi:hypothetical protein
MDDLDLQPLAVTAAPSDSPPDLVVRDLTATAITAHGPGDARIPTLTLSRRGDRLAISMSYHPDTLEEEAALALVAGVAARLAEPLRHLL